MDLSTNIYLTAQRKAFFDDKKKRDYLSLSYNSSFKKINYNLNFSYNKTTGSTKDFFTSMGIRVPLGSNAPQISYNYNRNDSKTINYTHRYNIQDSLLSDDSLSYNLSLEKTNQEDHRVNALLDFDHMAGNISAGYINHKSYRAIDLSMKGSAMLHSRGLTLGQPLGNTHALVYIKNTPNIEVDNQFNTKTDRWGYAIATDLSPYQNNNITVDTLSLPDDWEIEKEDISITPTLGAVSLVSFPPPIKSKSMEASEISNNSTSVIESTNIQNQENEKLSAQNQKSNKTHKLYKITWPNAVQNPSLRPKIELNKPQSGIH